MLVIFVGRYIYRSLVVAGISKHGYFVSAEQARGTSSFFYADNGTDFQSTGDRMAASVNRVIR